MLATLVTDRRNVVLVGTLVTVALLAMGIPRMKADFTPSDLFAKFEDQEAVAEEFREAFGNTDNVLLVLVQADDVLTVPVLQYQHELNQHFSTQPWASRVDGLTTLPLPREPGAAERAEASEGFIAALYTAGTTSASHVAQAASRIRGSEPRVDIPDEVPDMVVSIAAGNGTVQSAVAGDTVTNAEAENLREAVRSPLLEGRLISRDHSVTTLAIPLAEGMDRNAELSRIVSEARTHLAANPPPEGADVMLGGLPFLRTAVIAKMRADQSVMIPLALGVCILILFVSFRWLPAMVLPTLAVAVSAVALVGGMGLVGEPMNILNSIIPLLIIIIGISNTIHLVNRYGEEIRAGKGRREASREAVKRMAVACFLTSVTTAIGFASLVVSRTELLRRFGLLAAVGVIIAYVVTITFLPAALTYAKAPKVDSAAAREGMIERMMERLTRAILRHPVPVLVISLVVAILAVQQIRSVQIDSAVLDQFDPSDEIYQTTELVESKLAGVRPLEVYLTSDTPGAFNDPEVLNTIDGVAQWARMQEGVIGTISYTDFLRAVAAMSGGEVATTFTSQSTIARNGTLLEAGERNPVAPYVNADRTAARLNIGLRDFGAQATIRFADALEAELATRFADHPGVTVRLTGDAYTGSKGLNAVITDLLGSLGLAVFIIFGFMTLLFRSARLAALSVPPNVIPLMVTMAFMALMKVPLNAATAIIFSVSIGLAVDGSIHVLARFREEVARRDDVDEALVAAARGTGKAIIMTCLSLMLGFGVMLASSFVPVRRFGQLIAITVFGCLLATVIVLPALLKIGWIGHDSNGDS